MKKSALHTGKYKISPIPKNRDSSSLATSEVTITLIGSTGIEIVHNETGRSGLIYWDSILSYAEPGVLLVKGQLWVETATLSFEPGFDPRLLQSVAERQGLGIYRLKPTPADGQEDLETAEIHQLISGIRTKEALSRLKALRLTVRDKRNELQVLIALLTWNPSPKNPESLIQYADRGIAIATDLGLLKERTVVLSYRALYRTQQATLVDLDGIYRIKMSNASGVPLITEPERHKLVKHLDTLWLSVESDLKDASDGVKKDPDLNLAGLVLSNRISAIGLRAMHYRGVGLDWKPFVKHLHTIFEAAKDLHREHQLNEMLAYIYHNMANQLRFLDAEDEALALARESFKMASQMGEGTLVQTSRALIKELESTKKGQDTN